MNKSRFNQRKQRLKNQATPAQGKTVPTSSTSGHVKVGHQAGGVAAGIYVEHQTINNPALTGHSTTAPVGRIHGNPPTLSAAFTGREEILQALHTTLHNDNAALTPPPAALQGLGGIGKTQTALAYLYRHQNDYADLFWAIGETPEQLAAGFTAFAPTLDPPVLVQADQNATLQQVKQWFATHDNWLLVIDNAENLSKLKAVLPPLNKGRLLITTRDVATGGLARRLEVDRLDKENGALLLLRRAGLMELDTSFADLAARLQEGAHAISLDVDGLPLALDQAGAYIETRQITLVRYRELYQQRREALHHDYDNPDHASVAVTFNMALEQVEQVPTYGPAAAQLVRLCAFLAPDAIPEEIFTAGASELDEPLASLAADPNEFVNVWAAACRYALIRHDATSSTFTMHRLVQEVMRENLIEDERKRLMQQVVLAVMRIFPWSEFSEWLLCERLFPHALVCAEYIRTYGFRTEESAFLLNRIAWYLKHRAHYIKAELFFCEALAIYRESLGSEDPAIATILNNLGLLYGDMGRYADAIPLYKEALEIDRKTIGIDNHTYALRLNNLGLIYYLQRHFDEAEPLFQQALDITRGTLGAEHSSVATRLNNLAIVYSDTQRYEQAEALLREALDITRKTWGETSPSYAGSLMNLGALYIWMSRLDEADAMLHDSMTIRVSTLGSHHPDVAACHHWTGILRYVQGNREMAAAHFRFALEIQECMLGSNHPHTMSARANLTLLEQE